MTDLANSPSLRLRSGLDQSRRKREWVWTSISAFIVMVIAIVLASRHIPATYDDGNYISYFSGLFRIVSRNIFVFLVEEPVWNYGAEFLGDIFGPVLAYRVVMFFSVCAFFVAGKKLGAWLIPLALIFVCDIGLATGLYSFAVRQGVATSLIVTLFALGMGPVAAVLVAGLVHTGVLLLLPAAVIAQFVSAGKFRWAAAIAIGVMLIFAIMIGTGVFSQVFGGVDLGRRNGFYKRTMQLNYNFYIVSFFQYGLVLWLARDSKSPFYIFVACCTIMTVGLLAYDGNFGRLALTVNALTSIYLCTRLRKLGGQGAIALWLALIVFINIGEARRADNTLQSWEARWKVLLTR